MCVLPHYDVIDTPLVRYMSLGKRAVRCVLLDLQSAAYCLAQSCERFERSSFTLNGNQERKGFIVRLTLVDANGREVAECETPPIMITDEPGASGVSNGCECLL
jgi:hypothetical protein